MSEAPAKTEEKNPAPAPEAAAAAPEKAPEKAAAPEVKPGSEQPKVPEKYELKSRKDSPLQKGDLEEIEAAAKAKGLSQEDAQRLVESREADYDKFSQRQNQAYKDQMDVWKKEVSSDVEIAGKDGKAFKENIELAHRALNRFADDAFKKVLNESGLGNNPHLIRTFLRIGQRIAEDKAVLDGINPTPGGKKSREELLFPSHFKNKNKE